jgi:hypothetical protein
MEATAIDITAIDTAAVRAEMLAAARVAADEMYARIGGDRYACGFAWVTIHPKHKGNTKPGRAERAVYTALGFKLDYTGKTFQLWNPSGSPVQNVDIKEAGATAAANVLRKYGIVAYCGSRLD